MTLEQCSAAIKELMSMMKKSSDEENPESTEKVRHEGDVEPKDFVKKADGIDESEEEKKDDKKAEDGDETKPDGDTEKPAGMDAKSLFVQISERNKLAEALSKHIGTFDHADKTLKEVAQYGVKKLGLTCKPGHEYSTVAGYLAGAKLSSVAKVATDSKVESGCVDAYIKGSK